MHCSGVLLSMYFIANFVVPGILTNTFGYDKSNEEQKDDEDDENDEIENEEGHDKLNEEQKDDEEDEDGADEE
ncbi:unnamed protein product [Sphenostylis stenocarpa]|uniref:Uncharacterized protein n=1 Tax=Sphenostylis stenocarpa TaxID=92480 RepID=A0AA86SZ78_9FABA|nr:unnamed protein product [Sphenostylis stenocarpa]